MPDIDTPKSPANQDYKKLFVKKNLFLRKHENQENEDEFLDLIRFSLVNETYGIELSRMKEILKVKNIESIPNLSSLTPCSASWASIWSFCSMS